jgi:hypothetical protein
LTSESNKQAKMVRNLKKKSKKSKSRGVPILGDDAETSGAGAVPNGGAASEQPTRV